MNAGLVLAIGRSELMGAAVDPAFLSLGSKPVMAYALQAFERCAEIEEVVLVVRKDRVDPAKALAQMFGCAKVKHVVGAGQRQSTAVLAALDELGEDIELVAVHDAVRPCVTPDMISQSLACARKHGSGVVAHKVEESVKVAGRNNQVSRSLDPDGVWIAQTPQSFKIEVLRKAMKAAEDKDWDITDVSEAVEKSGAAVRLIPGSAFNIRIATGEDLAMAASVLRL